MTKMEPETATQWENAAEVLGVGEVAHVSKEAVQMPSALPCCPAELTLEVGKMPLASRMYSVFFI
jgi:hypothetical protein